MIRSILIAALGAAALTGCALLSSPEPAQLYRFGGQVQAQPAGAQSVEVSLRRIDFPEAVRGDRILGVTGTEAAYIAGARWVSPADALYTDALHAAFAGAQRVRLIGARDLAREQLALDINVTTFEARYDAPGAAPTAVVAATVTLVRLPSRELLASERFIVSQLAGENRVSAIVAAFDVATRDLNTQLVGWTDGVAR